MSTDQAQRLRELAAGTPGGDQGPGPVRRERAVETADPRSTRLAHATAVVSGKGGVGKSNIALNLAVSLARHRQRVVLFDADMGMANLDVLCGVTPQATLEDVLRGRCTLKDALLSGPGGFKLVPGSSGVAAMANLDGMQRRRVLGQLAALDRVADHLVLDMGAGISPSVMSFAVAAHRVLVVTTPEPTAMTDAYGAIKTLLRRGTTARLELVVNMAHSRQEGVEVHARLARVLEQFTGGDLHLAAIIPADAALQRAVRKRTPVLLSEPDSAVSRALEQLGGRVRGEAGGADDLVDPHRPARGHGMEATREGFFQRMSRLILGKGS